MNVADTENNTLNMSGQHSAVGVELTWWYGIANPVTEMEFKSFHRQRGLSNFVLLAVSCISFLFLPASSYAFGNQILRGEFSHTSLLFAGLGMTLLAILTVLGWQICIHHSPELFALYEQLLTLVFPRRIPRHDSLTNSNRQLFRLFPRREGFPGSGATSLTSVVPTSASVLSGGRVPFSSTGTCINSVNSIAKVSDSANELLLATSKDMSTHRALRYLNPLFIILAQVMYLLH
jgi:hypothetical protein